MSDEELDALDIIADLQRLVDNEGDVLARASLRLITSLRAQLAEVKAELSISNRMVTHNYELCVAANARANRAEAALDKAKEETKDAISTLEFWFDRRELGHKAVDQAVLNAASGYLRTSRSGGMPQEESDLVLAVFQDMAHLGVFADLFARSAKTQVDAALAAQIEEACAVIDAHAEYDQAFCCDGRECGCQGVYVHDVMKQYIRQPHDRTALDRMLAEAEARGIRRAADLADTSVNSGGLARSMAFFMRAEDHATYRKACEDYRKAILALIDSEQQKENMQK